MFYQNRLSPFTLNHFLGVILIAACFFSGVTQADESLWIYTKGSDTLPKGKIELKLNTVTRAGKNSGDYRFSDIRPEIEYGITDRLTISGEVLIFDHDYSVDDPDLNPMFETQGGAGQTYNNTQYAGYEVKLKYNLLSAYKDIIGFAVGLGYENRDQYRLDGADIDQDSFVVSLYFQKDFLDDTLITALTAKTEFERRRSPGVLEEEIAFDIAAAISYRVVPNWFVGLEFRHQSDYLNPQEDGEFDPTLKRSSFDLSDFRLGSQHQRGNYLGPTVHYAQQEWWVTAGILWQIRGGGSPHSFSTHNRNWDEHERYHMGLSIGYEF